MPLVENCCDGAEVVPPPLRADLILERAVEPQNVLHANTPRRRKSAEVRRQDIVKAAMEIIRHQGLDKLTTRSLARAVGIAQPTLFLHFGNKSQVLMALVDALRTRMEDNLHDLALERLPPGERLRATIRFYLDFIDSQPGVARLLFSEELQSADDELRERVNGLTSYYRGVVGRQIEAGQADGVLRTDLDPRAAAHVLVGALQGLAFCSILRGQRCSTVEQSDIVLETFLHGWTAPRSARA